MNKNRKWRVQTLKEGMKAPVFFVETHKHFRFEAEQEARTLVEQRSVLVSKYNWDYILEEQVLELQ